MKNDSIISDHLLVSYLKGKTSVEETQAVENWLSEDAKNKSELEKIEQIWSSSTSLSDFESIDLAKNWSQVQSKLNKEGETRKSHFWKYAAAILLIATVSFLILQPGEVVMKQTLAYDGPKQVTLPDGSEVWLNKGASLDYPESFASRSREVTLKGEAFFEVAHNPEKPFIVTADGTTTEVLGTSFNIKEGEGEVLQLVLETGKVRFTKDRKRATLAPGDMINVDAQGNITKTTNTDRNFISWKTKKLVFENTPMTEVVGDISKLYGVVLEITDKDFLNCPLTTTFQNETLEEVMETIEMLFNIEVKQSGQLYQLVGKGCEN